MKRKIPTSGLVVLPKTGHAINLEEPDAFNRAVLDFLTAVDAGRWPLRDPASLGRSAILPTCRRRSRGIIQTFPARAGGWRGETGGIQSR